MSAPAFLDGGPGPEPLTRTATYLARELSPTQRRALRSMGPGTEPMPLRPVVDTYDRLEAMGLIVRTRRYGGQVTELGHAVLRLLASGADLRGAP